MLMKKKMAKSTFKVHLKMREGIDKSQESVPYFSGTCVQFVIKVRDMSSGSVSDDGKF